MSTSRSEDPPRTRPLTVGLLVAASLLVTVGTGVVGSATAQTASVDAVEEQASTPYVPVAGTDCVAVRVGTVTVDAAKADDRPARAVDIGYTAVWHRCEDDRSYPTDPAARDVQDRWEDRGDAVPEREVTLLRAQDFRTPRTVEDLSPYCPRIATGPVELDLSHLDDNPVGGAVSAGQTAVWIHCSG